MRQYPPARPTGPCRCDRRLDLLAEGLDVAQVLVSAGGALVGDECRASQKRELAITDDLLNALDPRGPEIRHTADRGQHVNPVWRNAKLHHRVRGRQIRGRDAKRIRRGAETTQRGQHPRGIVCRRIDPHVKVLRRSWYPVRREGVRADDEKVHFLVEHRDEEFKPVVGHFGRTMATGQALRGSDGQALPLSSHARRVSEATSANRSDGVNPESASVGSAPSRYTCAGIGAARLPEGDSVISERYSIRLRHYFPVQKPGHAA